MLFSSPICRTDDNSVCILHSSLLSDRKLNLAIYHVLYYRKEGNTLNKDCGPVPLLGEHFRNDSIHIRCSRCSVRFLFVHHRKEHLSRLILDKAYTHWLLHLSIIYFILVFSSS